MRKALLAAALLACAFDGLAAEELRTLFHSPGERQQLDRLRRGEPAEPAEEEAAVKRAPQVVNGIVKRSDGRQTVWIDGQPVSVSEARRLLESGKAQDDHRPTEIKRAR